MMTGQAVVVDNVHEAARRAADQLDFVRESLVLCERSCTNFGVPRFTLTPWLWFRVEGARVSG